MPASGEAQRFLGACQLRGGRVLEALDCFQRAVALEPAVAMNHTALAMAHQQLNEHARALHHLEQAVALAPRSAGIFSAYLFELSHHPSLSPAHVFAEHVRYGHTFGGRGDRFRHDNSPDPHRRLRIGYVSGDFYQHSAMLFLLPVLTRHDSRHYETFAYSNVFRPDQVTETVKGAVAHWRPIQGLSDDAAAALVHADRIDIVVDLAGHTDSNRLPVFARKPAPVQVSWLGYPATTGLAEIDYRLVNSATSPDRDAFFTERLYRMASASTCFNFPADTPAPAPPPALANGFITFGSFSAPRKMSREIIAVWAAIMHEVPGSRLFLKYAGLGEAERCRWFVETFGSLGVTADRLEFADYSPYAEHLRAYDRVDVALDPFPYPGGTTTRNALWCGVPVITLDARTTSPTATLLRQLGLGACVAHSEQDYVARAVAVAADLDRLATWRAALRAKLAASESFNAEDFTRSLENAFRDMWTKWCRGAEVVV